MTAQRIFENISSRILQAGKHISNRVVVFTNHLPGTILKAAKRLILPVFNIYVLFWCLKHLQRKILDPLLDGSIGMSTLNGWKSERALRHSIDVSMQSSTKSKFKNLRAFPAVRRISTELMYLASGAWGGDRTDRDLLNKKQTLTFRFPKNECLKRTFDAMLQFCRTPFIFNTCDKICVKNGLDISPAPEQAGTRSRTYSWILAYVFCPPASLLLW